MWGFVKYPRMFEDVWTEPWRIHGAAIYGVPWIPSIYPLYVSIFLPAPWIRHGWDDEMPRFFKVHMMSTAGKQKAGHESRSFQQMFGPEGPHFWLQDWARRAAFHQTLAFPTAVAQGRDDVYHGLSHIFYHFVTNFFWGKTCDFFWDVRARSSHPQTGQGETGSKAIARWFCPVRVLETPGFGGNLMHFGAVGWQPTALKRNHGVLKQQGWRELEAFWDRRLATYST